MARPYQLAESTKRSLGGLRRGSITLVGIEDLFAQATSVREVTPKMISKICEERRIDLAGRLIRGRKELYRRYLRYCFEDKVLSQQERDDLVHLRSLLHLSAEAVATIHDEVAIEVYGEAVQEVLEDFKLDDDEAVFLRELREGLGLTDEKADRVYRDGSIDARARARSLAQLHDRQFVEHREPAGEFAGRSNATLEGAIEDALANATLAIPSLQWFEVTQIAGYVADRKTGSWHITLRAGVRRDKT